MNKFGERIGSDAVRFQRLLPGPIERVWSWVTESEKRQQWLAGGEFELKENGDAELIFNNASLSDADDVPPEKYRKYAGEVRYACKVKRVEEPHLISFDWFEAEGFSSEVTIKLEAQGDKVLLTLTHRLLTDLDALSSAMGGWHVHLDIMAAKLSGETPLSFWSAHTAMDSAYLKKMA